MIDGPCRATLPDGRTLSWTKVDQGTDGNNNSTGGVKPVGTGKFNPEFNKALQTGIDQRTAARDKMQANVATLPTYTKKGVAESTGQFHVYHKVKGDRMGGPDYELLKSFPDKNSAVVFAKSYNEKHGYKRGGFHGAVIRTTTPTQGMAEGLGYSQDPAQAKWYHEGRKAFKGGTTGNLIQDIAKKHGVPEEWIDAFHAGYQDQEGFGKDTVDEGDNLATFEQDGCNQTMEGEYCPEHGLAECGMYEMGTVAGGMAPVIGEAPQDPINYNGAITGAYYESKSDTALLARIKSLALLR